MPTDDRLDRIEDRMGRIEDRVERVQGQVIETRGEVREARADIQELTVLISGPPRDDSLRGRLHKLEDSEATAKAAEAALTAAKAMYERRGETLFTRRQTIAVLVFTFVMAACALATLAVTLSHHP